MSPPEFAIPAHELDAAGRHFRLPLRRQWLRGALEGTDVNPTGEDGELDVRVSKSGTDVVVRGTLSAELEVPCARCLEPARVRVHEELSALAVTAPVGAGGAAPPPSGRNSSGFERDGAGEEDAAGQSVEDADVLPYDGETLVLDDLVRDELLLGIPMIPLCSEGCPGIRPESVPAAQGSSGAPAARATSPAPEGQGQDPSSIDPRLRPLLGLKSKT